MTPPQPPLAVSGQQSRLRVERIDLLNATAQAFIMSARLGEAVSLLEDVLALDPQNAQAYLYLATAYEAMGLIEQSMQAFRTATELEPDNVGLVSASVFGYCGPVPLRYSAICTVNSG